MGVCEIMITTINTRTREGVESSVDAGSFITDGLGLVAASQLLPVVLCLRIFFSLIGALTIESSTRVATC